MAKFIQASFKTKLTLIQLQSIAATIKSQLETSQNEWYNEIKPETATHPERMLLTTTSVAVQVPYQRRDQPVPTEVASPRSESSLTVPMPSSPREISILVQVPTPQRLVLPPRREPLSYVYDGGVTLSDVSSISTDSSIGVGLLGEKLKQQFKELGGNYEMPDCIEDE